MAYQDSNYNGDNIYTINCNGDAVVGDEVCFDRATFTGSFRNAKFAGFERVTGRIIRDSYGSDKQQHTFTILMDNGKTTRIKGRNLYKNNIYRKKWADETERKAALDEKHSRGAAARDARAQRLEGLL